MTTFRPDDMDSVDEAAQDWFLRLSSGEAAQAELRAFAAWRAADPRHAAAYAEIRALWSDVEPLEAAFAPGGHAAALLSPPLRRPFFRPGRVPALAAGLVALCLALWPAAGGFRPAGILADHRTAIGERQTIALPDGSVLSLNTDSAVDVAYSDNRRLIRLRYGEAHFEVRRDAARPFDVEAEGGRSTAVGTAFTVRDDGGGAVVTVSEGIVRVASPAAGPGIALGAGGQVRYRRAEPPGTPRGLDADGETAWLRGRIVVRDRPLAEALAEIERHRRGRIVLLNGDAGGSVSARLSLDDLDGGIDALAATHGLSVTRLTPFLVVLR